MAHIEAIDVSQYQGNINWAAVDRPIAIIKMSGGDAGLYTDSKANQNYYGAKAAGKLVGGYHFAGGGNPQNEADFFVAAMSPLEENDVLALDWEIEHPDPVGWCNAFVDRVHDRTGVWPLFYTNGARLNAHDFSSVRAKCGTWVAWYGMNPEGNLPVSGNYVMHQYSSTGAVPGIAGNVDHDAWFSSLDVFKKYGYHAPATPAPPPPPPAPVPPPEPVPVPPAPDPKPPVDPDPPPAPPAPTPEPTPIPPVPSSDWKKIVGGIIAAVAAAIAAIIAWLHS